MDVAMLRSIERSLWVVGAGLLGFFLAARWTAEVSSKRELARFEEARNAIRAALIAPAADASPATGLRRSMLELPNPDRVDLRGWDAARIRAYKRSLARDTDTPLGVLRIPRLGLEVPVLDGTDALTLNRGAGWIEGTAAPGEDGNVGIAAHRDGFFRRLQEIRRGDSLELDALEGGDRYVVQDLRIVDPKDVHVLDATPERTVTLVTCYPFHYVGPAPQRFVVRAVAVR